MNPGRERIKGLYGRPLDQIALVGVTARGYHGVLDSERENGQDFTADVVLHLDTSLPAATDDLKLTADYGDLATRVAEVIRGEPFDLIETLAERIAQVCLTPAPVLAVDVTVHKPYAPISERFADVQVSIRRMRERSPLEFAPLDRAPVSPVEAVLALGSNLGDRIGTLRSAVAALASMPGIEVHTVSGVVETAAVGGPEQPDYLNAVLLITTGLSAHDLLAACHRVEAAHHRVRDIRWGPRTLDIDVIRYGGLISAMPDLALPHPRAAQRAFVLAPWVGADPDATLPIADGAHAVREMPVAGLLAQAPDRAEVHERPDLELRPAVSDPVS